MNFSTHTAKNMRPKAVKEFSGTVVAIIHRQYDVAEKWVVAPDEMTFAKEEIAKEVNFQEKFFKSQIE